MELLISTDSSTSEPDLFANCAVVRRFIEYLFTQGDSPEFRRTVDWEVIREAVAGSSSLEQAIDRAVAVADLMSRGIYPRQRTGADPSPPWPSSSSTPEIEDATHLSAIMRTIFSAHKGASSIVLAISLFLIAVSIVVTSNLGGTAPTAFRTHEVPNINGNGKLVSTAVGAAPTTVSPVTTTTVSLPAATVPPAPAPPSLADAPPLRPHEVFGFAPYWTLPLSPGFDVSQISTIAYFSIGVNPDGSLDMSGPGWNGYQSQSLANLVTRAHGSGDRVVLTVNDFDQDSLNQLTSSPTAPSTLAKALIGAIQAKNLDGVNFDFEGQGSSDQAGLTNLVTQVSAALHGVDPNYQVTMDTYASSAADPNGFYNIRALAPAVNAFFVMEYQLNLQSGASPVSPLTSTMFSDKTAIDQYAASVPPAKVILGLPFFGIDWPTSDGTLSAHATGPATTVSLGQIMAGGHPIYWDATTDTAWTSYQIGTQWHETFFEVPSSLYDAAQLASSNNLAGMGIWALGMDGNDSSMESALLGFSPAVKDYAAGPLTTSSSSTTTTSTSTTTTTTTSTSTTSTSTLPSSTISSSSGSASTTSTSGTPTSTTDTSTSSTIPSPPTSTSTTSTTP